jgi:hypothetical protein
MSIKDLFGNSNTKQLLKVKTLESASAEIEGIDYLKAKSKEKDEFVPPVDFSTASNFAKFGSAEMYYQYAFQRIQQQYPYDGTKAEMQEFENSSTYLDRYIFENHYPRFNGYINLSLNGLSGGSQDSEGYYTGATSKEYIYIYGGPHTASGGMTGKKLHDTFDKSTLHDTKNRRENNLEIDFDYGNSIEFWFKKIAFDATVAKKETIFEVTDQTNNKLSLFLSASADGTSPLYLRLSGATESITSIADTSTTTASIGDNKWHHYALTLKTSSAGIFSRFFIDSQLNNEVYIADSPYNKIEPGSKGIVACIGSKATSSLGNGQMFSASMDEFRFWKKERTGKEIGQNWFTHVGGGTDDSLDNVDLGVYFKFNEGITGDASKDSIMIDYSGRLSNGTFNNYSTTDTRNVGSAIVLGGAATSEFKDPTIYDTHPDYISQLAGLKLSGSIQDDENTGMMIEYFPSWLVDEDGQNGEGVKKLVQIMASYFDTLYSQINHLNKIKEPRYFGPTVKKDTFTLEHTTVGSDKDKPYPFSQNLLRNKGFVVPNLFVEANIVEEFLEHDKNQIYEKDIERIRDLVYQNIYNNLEDIYKSKGTKKSFYRLLKNFGINSDLIKLNLYADNSTFLYTDNYELRADKTRALNNNNVDNFTGTVFNHSSSDSLGYIPTVNQDQKYSAITLEGQFLIPKKPDADSDGYFATNFYTSSVMGFHRIDENASLYDFHSTDKHIVVKLLSTTNREHSKFLISGSDGIYLTSSVIPNIYDNQVWNLALRIKNHKYPNTKIEGASEDKVIVELYGVNTENTTKHNSFYLSSSTISSAATYLSSSKKLFVGAERQNFTGSALCQSDVKVLNFRFWNSYLDNEAVDNHAFYGNSYSTDNILDNDSPTLLDSNVPKSETLALHWNFSTNTGSDGSGNFVVIDESSGSSEYLNTYGWVSEISKNRYDGKGYQYNSTTDRNIFDYVYFSDARRLLPDAINLAQSVDIKGLDETTIFQDDEIADNFYSLEKSMQGVISSEMLNMFATVKDFNKIIGDMKEKYRPEYKDLKYLKRLFFSKIENEPDQERFFEFYKWIDSSISYAIRQLFPASARFSENVLDVVESHILERNKYQQKFPMLSDEVMKQATILGAEELNYNWRLGHAPNHDASKDNELDHCTWQKERREDTAGSDEDSLRQVINTKVKKPSIILKTAADTHYSINDDIRRFRPRPYVESYVLTPTIHGGTNYQVSKNRDLHKDYIRVHGTTNASGVPQNVFVVGVGEGQGLVPDQFCKKENNPNAMVKYSFVGIVGKNSNNDGTGVLDDEYSYTQQVKGQQHFPFNLVSESVSTGYNKVIDDNYLNNAVLTNLHADTTYLTNDEPMQGPFTRRHVGGHQSRHVKVNKYNSSKSTTNNIDDQYIRPEAFRILFGDHPSASVKDGAMGMVGPDYGGPYPDYTRQIAIYYRDERAKRPINIRNIQHDSDSSVVGNYRNNYEVVSSFGRRGKNLRFNSLQDNVDFVESNLKTALVGTNVNAGLFAQKASNNGAVFLSGANDPNYFKEAVRGHLNPVESLHADNKSTKSIITTKFSAPGGPEVMTPVFLDAIDQELSPYNSLNHRNSTVRSSGSGEVGSIRVNSHLNKREGLLTNLRRHTGQFGVDSVHGAGTIVAEGYSSVPGFHKQHRNNRFKPKAYEFYTGQKSSGSFQVIGMSYSGSFATGSFVLTGSTIYGLAASGSFTMKGAYYGGQQASASFKVIGRNIPGQRSANLADHAAAELKGSGSIYLGAQATGSFTIPSATTVGTAVSRQLSLPGRYIPSNSATSSFSVGGRTIIGVNSSGSFSITGSTDPNPLQRSYFELEADSPSRYGDRYAVVYYLGSNVETENVSGKQTNGSSTYGVAFGGYHIGQNTDGTDTSSTGTDRRIPLWESTYGQLFQGGSDGSGGGGASDTSWTTFTTAVPTYSGNINEWNTENEVESTGTGTLISFWIKFDADNAFNTAISNNSNNTLFRFKNSSDEDSVIVYIYKDASGNFDLRIRKFWDENDGAGSEGYTNTTYADFFNDINYGDNDWYHIVISHHNFSHTNSGDHDDVALGSNGKTHNNGANSHEMDIKSQSAVDGTHIWVNGSAYTTSRSLSTINNIVDARESGGSYYKGSRPRSVSRFAIKHYGSNFGSLGALNVRLDDLFIFDEGYQPARFYDLSTNRYIDTANWGNGSHNVSTNGLTSDIPTPAQLYNSGKFLSYSALTALSDNALVAAYMMDEENAAATLVAINNSDQNLTINENVSRDTRSDSFSGTNHRSSTDVLNDFSSSINYIVGQLGGGYAAQFLTASNGSVGLQVYFTGSNSLDTSQGDKRNDTFSNRDSTYGLFYVGGKTVPVYEPRTTQFDFTDTITVNSSTKSIKHFSFADKGELSSFGSLSGSAPSVRYKNYSTRAFRWDSESSGTDYGPILYNTSFAYLSDDEDNLTISFWTRLKTNSSTSKYILTLWQDSGDTTPASKAVYVYASYDNLYIRFYDKSGNYRLHQYNDILSVDRYSHIAITVDRTAATNTPTVYLNGSSISRDATSDNGSPSGRMQNVNSVFIGDYPSTSASYEFVGWITQMSFWKDAVDAAEIFNKGRWKWLWSHPSANKLFAWYQLGDDSEVPASNDPPDALGQTNYGSTALNTSEKLLTAATITNDIWKYASATDNLTLTATIDSLIYVSHGIIKEEVNLGEDFTKRGGPSYNTLGKYNDADVPHLAPTKFYGFLNEVTGVIKATYGDFAYEIVGTPDYDNDTIKVTHNANGPVTSTSNVSATTTTFNNVDSNFSGFHRGGLQSGDKITIDSTTFEFYTGSSSDVQGGNTAVDMDANNSTIWGNLRTAIISATYYDTITVNESYGTSLALFSITSSREEPSEINSITVPADGVVYSGSCATIVDQTNAGVTGQNESRDHTEDYLKIIDDNSSDEHFIYFYIGGSPPASPSGTARYIRTDDNASDSVFWSKIETEFGNLNNAWSITNNDDGTFDLTAPSAGTSYNGKQIFGSGSTDGFTVTGPSFAGGSDASGIADSSNVYVTLDSPSDNYRIYFTHASSEYNTSTTSRIDVSGTNAPATDELLWEEIRDRLETRLSDVTVTTASSGNPRTFTLTCDLTGSSRNFGVTATSIGGGSVSAQSNGTDESGAPDGGTFTINGVVFEYSASLPAGSGGGNVVIDSDVSQASFRTNVSNAITGSSLGPNVIVNNTGDNFTLTARNIGTAYNYGITQNNASLGSLLGMAGGENTSGSSAGNSFTINSIAFQVTDGSPAASTNLSANPFYIAATGSDAAYWNQIEYAIDNHNGTFFSASYSGAGGTRTFYLTGSITGSANNGQPSATSGHSFSVEEVSSGGTDEDGARDGHTLDIRHFDGTANESQIIIDIDQAQPYLKSSRDYFISASTSDNTTFWNNILAAINENSTIMTASYTHSSNTASFTLLTKESTDQHNQGGGSATYAWVDLDGVGHDLTFPEINGDTTPSTSPHYFAGGINGSGSQPNETISINSTTLTLKTASIGANDIDISPSIPDADVWESMRTKINSQVSNFTATTGSDDPRTFTVTHSSTGSGNSPSISSGGSSFASILNFDGTNELGADDPHTITIDGVVFEINNNVPSGQNNPPSNVITAGSYPGEITNTQFWNNASSSMNTNLADYDVTYVADSPTAGKATFYITASASGSAHNTTIATTASSFISVSPSISGGFDGYQGVVHNDSLHFFFKENATEHFIYRIDLNNSISDASNQDSPNLSSISSSTNAYNFASKNIEFWNIITQSIKDNSDYTEVSYSVISDIRAAFSFTASVTGSDKDGCTFETGSSFLIASSDVVGGVTYEEIPGTNYKSLYDNAYVTTLLPATEFQYSWINKSLRGEYFPTGSTTTGSNTRVLRYSDKTGLTRVGNDVFNSIDFPSSSIFTFN